jgi:hypothetical protein
MACNYTIIPERRLVETVASGMVTFSEVASHQGRLSVDPLFDPEFDQLIDASAVTSFGLSAREAGSIATRKFFSPTSRRAFVAVRPVVFGMARLMQAHYNLMCGAEQARVFRSREAAEEWLSTGKP